MANVVFMSGKGRQFYNEANKKYEKDYLRVSNRIAQNYGISLKKAVAVQLVIGHLIEFEPSFINQLNGDETFSDGQKVMGRINYYFATETFIFDTYLLLNQCIDIVKDIADNPRFNRRKNGENIFTFAWRIISDFYAKMDDVPSVVAKEHIKAVA